MEELNEYKLLAPFQNHNAGFSRWTYASRRSREFFLKEFMNPVYPDESSLSTSLREKRIFACEEYETEKRALYKAINACSDGNLVRIFEFFRYDSHYYIAMPRIHAEDLSFHEISSLPLAERVLLCRTLAHSVMVLHSAHIVHSDLKETNILLHRTRNGRIVAKLTDFDCSFFEDTPPTSDDELGGDQVYLSPEACQFICGDSVKLTCQMDVFSMGLLFHQYLTGELPAFDLENYDYAHEAALDDQELKINERLPTGLQELLHKMLLCTPVERVSSAEVFRTLGEYIPASFPPATSSSPPPPKDTLQQPQAQPKKHFFTEAGDL